MAGADGITDFVYGVVNAPDQLQHPLIHRLHDDWRQRHHLVACPGVALPTRCGSVVCSACWW